MSTKTKEQQKKSNEEDFEAIRKILAGNTREFDFLQKKYKFLISSLIRKMVSNEDDVEDLTQESFIKAYKALDKFQFGYSFSAWIYRIASNTCIDFLRKKRFKTISINKPLNDDDDDYFIEIEDRSYIPENQVLKLERKELLDNAISELPDNYKEIIRLRHNEELDYKEIADKLDLPLGTVKAHLFRARKMLYEILKKQVHLFKGSID